MAIHTAHRILLCLRYGIGDVVMELPAVEALRQAAPRAHITVLGARPALDLLDGDPRVDAAVSVHEFGFTHWGDLGSDAAIDRFRQWYEAGQFDLVLDPSHAVAGVGQVLWLSHAALRDAGPSLQAEALRQGARGCDAVRYAVERGWGLHVAAGAPRLYVSPDAQAQADAWLARAGFEHGRVVAFSPAASSPLKRWPIPNLIAVGHGLAKRDWRIAVLAGPEEEVLAQSVCDALPPHTAACLGTPHLHDVAALLSRCRLLLCNDTGLMHIASAVGTAPVAVFGPTSPIIYAPERAVAIGGEDTACLCRRTDAFGPPVCVATGQCMREYGRCIDQVAVDEVLKALNRVIEGPLLRETEAWMPRPPTGC